MTLEILCRNIVVDSLGQGITGRAGPWAGFQKAVIARNAEHPGLIRDAGDLVVFLPRYIDGALRADLQPDIPAPVFPRLAGDQADILPRAVGQISFGESASTVSKDCVAASSRPRL